MYLLDTSVVSALVNPASAKYADATAFQAGLDGREEKLLISVVTIAEMQFGLGLVEGRTPKPSASDINTIRQRIKAAAALSEVLPIDRHVAREHGQLRAKWAWKCSPRKASQGKLKGTAPETWSDNWPASSLQITENDIWLAAIALNYDLTLVTIDRDFSKLAQPDVEPTLRVKRL